MKNLILLTFLVLSSNVYALSFSELAGTYEITAEDAPVSNLVTISEDGSVQLTEYSPYGEFDCTGSAVLEDTLLKSEMTCENGASFEQRINLANVDNFNAFSAPVYSSLYEMELVMDFVKIQE